ncbi:hypothetical protein [Nocardia cyriacigeorgica]|uniref:hypothetical protein n=1 Tax=Nocardia cyriacigeorgica TaxID=135487 RepID=UPI002456D16E|nr:hypothetical protein [Nocardia cyriacigeorgica]
MVSLVGDLPRAARNIWSLSFGDGIEPYAPAPSTVVYDEPHRCLRRFDRDEPSTQRPVLLVPPLAVTPACFDLRDGQSFVRFLLETGRQPYVIDYGQMTYADRDLGLEEWTHDIVPTAIRRVSQEHDGVGVDVVGWSLGGILAVLAGAGHADLPIASITAIAPPFDQRKTVTVAPLRILGAVTGGGGGGGGAGGVGGGAPGKAPPPGGGGGRRHAHVGPAAQDQARAGVFRGFPRPGPNATGWCR